jgi:hypothetical protein
MSGVIEAEAGKCKPSLGREIVDPQKGEKRPVLVHADMTGNPVSIQHQRRSGLLESSLHNSLSELKYADGVAPIAHSAEQFADHTSRSA